MMNDIPLSMASEELDTYKVSEKYTTTSGKEKTRTTTIRSMSNDGSLFVNIHSGRGSVCISKDMLPEVIEKLQSLKWKGSTTKDDSSDNAILDAIKQIGKNQQKISNRLDKLEKSKKKK
jgi:hypothetical protein